MKNTSPQQSSARTNRRPERRLLNLDECAAELGCCRRFLELEIGRGRLVAIRLSNRLLRVRDADWQAYLAAGVTKSAQGA